MSKNIYESKHKEPSYAGPPYTGPPYTGPPKTELTKPSKTELARPPKTNKDDDSNELINELKKLGVSTENLIDFDSPMDLLTNLHNGITTIKEVEEEQDKYESLLDELDKVDKDTISKKQSDIIDKIAHFFYEREDIIAMFQDYLRKTNIKGTGLKILTLNQMIKILPIALAQIKASNNSKSLLNEIRQIAYSLYRSKEITKKVYNNIIKSIKV